MNLSVDALFPFSTDGDGATRTGTWTSGPTICRPGRTADCQLLRRLCERDRRQWYHVGHGRSESGFPLVAGSPRRPRRHELDYDENCWSSTAVARRPIRGSRSPAVGGSARRTRRDYLSIVTNQPNALQTSTSHYRQSGAYGIGFDNVNGVLRHFPDHGPPHDCHDGHRGHVRMGHPVDR